MIKKSRSDGFSLIELMVVISIISLLSSIVFASLRTASKKAQVTADVQYLQQLLRALEMYRQDNNTYPMLVGSPGQTGSITVLKTAPTPPLGPTYIGSLPDTKVGPSVYYHPGAFNYGCGNSQLPTGYTYLITYIVPTGTPTVPLPQLYRFAPNGYVPDAYCIIAPQ